MFNGMWIRVGFQPEPQFMFCCTVVSIKLGFMAVSFCATLSWGLLPKVDSIVAPTHCYNMLANLFTPRCPIKLATHRFLRFNVRASRYFSTFDLSYLKLGIFFLFQPYVVAQQSYNRCSTVAATACGQNFAPSRSSECHLLSPRNVESLPNYRWVNNIINNVAPPIC